MRLITDLDFERRIVDLPATEAAAWGFRCGERGTHTSRTIMLQELSYVLDAAPGDASRRLITSAPCWKTIVWVSGRRQLASSPSIDCLSCTVSIDG